MACSASASRYPLPLGQHRPTSCPRAAAPPPCRSAPSTAHLLPAPRRLHARLPQTAVAAISVAFSTCAVLYMPFAAFGMTACAQVGNMLGAGGGPGDD